MSLAPSGVNWGFWRRDDLQPPQEFFDTYTRDLKPEDLQRLFTRDTRDAYRFFTRHVDPESLKGLPWHKRSIAYARAVFLAFTMKLSPARRIVFGASLGLALIGLLNLFT